MSESDTEQCSRTALPGRSWDGGTGRASRFFLPRSAAGAATMEKRLADKSGMYRYSIESTEVVNPEKVGGA